MTTWLHHWFWIQQDYLWFLAGIAWLAVGSLWWQGRRTGEIPAWVPWGAGAGIAIAVTQILSVITPLVHPTPNTPPSLQSDLWLGFIFAILAGGWWLTGLNRMRGRNVLAGFIAALALAGAVGRYENPNEGTILVTIILIGAVAWWLAARTAISPAWNFALIICGLAALLDTSGILASSTIGRHRWIELNSFGPFAALAQGAAACAVLAVIVRGNAARVADGEARQTERKFLGGVAAWLVFGLVLAITVGAWGRQDFERNALGRVRAISALLPPENVANLLDERFSIGEVQWFTFPNGARLPYAVSAHAAAHGASVTGVLAQIAAVNPDVRWITVSTLRDGWLVAAANAIQSPSTLGQLTLLRQSTADDEAAWNSRTASNSAPLQLSFGEVVFARAPLADPTGKMLGWLDFHFGVNQWIAAQARLRGLAYIVVALGIVIGRQLVVQRTRSRERDLARADAVDAQEASRLKTTFLANVSHELRTPLQSIQGYTELILPNVSPRDRERLLAVREHADLMGRLVNDLIDLSAAESGKFHLIERPVVLMDLVVQAAESLRHRAEVKGLALSVDASPEIPGWLYADPQRVRQVVLNLVGNAVKYTDYGSVDVVLALVGRDRDSAEIELRITDTGPGIAPEAQPYLFEAFHRLEQTKEREGTGLGLAIVAAVSKAMRGSVRVTSDGRSGSAFVARWRLRLAPNAGVKPSSRVPLHGKKILVADDNALVRDLFVAYLTECGAFCATASDGLDALRRLRGEEFDAVVLDLAMPRLDGLSAVRQIRREMPDKQWRIVGVSAHAGGAEHDEALTAGMDAFLIKPVALPDLARALAPMIGWIPPTRTFAPMRAHFEHRFRTDAPAQSAAVARALEGGRWPEIHAAAHYLKNSADVIGDSDLATACAALEAAARARDRKAGDEAWRHCRLALTRWLSEPAAN